MSPPGKNSGETTNESVVKARWAPPTSNTAWSSSFSSSGLRKAGRKICCTRSAVSLPPLPWPSVILPGSVAGTGQASCSKSTSSSVPGLWPLADRGGLSLSHMEPPILVVGGAGALRRDHAGADRRLRRADRPDDPTVPGLLGAAHDVAALAGLGVLHLAAHLEVRVQRLGVPGGVALAHAQAARWHGAHAAPAGVAGLEHLAERAQRHRVALRLHHARVLDLDRRAPVADLPREHQDRLQHVQRLEA